MTTTERAQAIGDAVSEGLNCIARIQGLRGSTRTVNAEDLPEWCATLEAFQGSLREMQADVEAGRAETSMPMSDELRRGVEELQAEVSALSLSAPLPDALFDRADAVWAAFAPGGPPT